MYRKKTSQVLLLCTIVFGLCLGCSGKKDPNQKPTFRVKGSVTVDDEIPSPPVQLVCHPKGNDTNSTSTDATCVSNEDGTFEFTTYKQGDGVPAGDYVITVTWKEFDLIKREYKAADKLKGRYSDPKKSTIELTVGKGPVDLGTIELTTK